MSHRRTSRSDGRPFLHRAVLALVPLCGLAAGGCLERELVVDSNPDGALVYMNDQEVGRTPIRREFRWYGTYDVVVRKEGYEPLRTKTPVIAPAWLWVPFDFFVEILPFRFTDTHHVRYELKAAGESTVDPDRMMARARELQDKLESGEKTVVKHPSTRPAKPSTRPATRPANKPAAAVR
jgi:hypothetical protein